MQDDDEKDGEKILTLSDGSTLTLGLRNGWYVLPRTGRAITSEMVTQWQAELDKEDVAKAKAFASGRLP